MKRFDVLSPDQEIDQSSLLEASAGTGKTFAIENIVVRLLIEGNNPLTLDQILIVTFTRLATRDLRQRIRANIQKALDCCLDSKKASLPYLAAILEQGEAARKETRRRLEQALFCFHQAQIFTIHSFCSRMLREHLFEGDVGLMPIGDANPLSNAELIKIIRDFFRTSLKVGDSYSIEQLNIVLKDHGNDIESLEHALLKCINNRLDIDPTTAFQDHFLQFTAKMKMLKQHFSRDKIIADFLTQAPFFKDLYNRQKVLKTECQDLIERFARLFDKEEWSQEDFDVLLADGLFLVTALDPQQRAAKWKLMDERLHYPQLVEMFREHLWDIVEGARNPAFIFARLACECQKMFREYLIENEKFSLDDILKSMHDALRNPLFLNHIRARYKAAIVDEFQDTDPIQWNIFRDLFLSNGLLYLVGDPKQSIYAFRQADIYTYLSAAQALGEDRKSSLDVNYRSQPSLIKALNHLFSSAPEFIALPKSNASLAYQEVMAGSLKEKCFADKKESLHFFIAVSQESFRSFPLEEMEEQYLFPFIAKELQHLQGHVPLNQCAILVHDRYQAQRTHAYLQLCGVPSLLRRSGSLVLSPALGAFRDLLQAVMHPRQESDVKIALGGRILRYTQNELRELPFEEIAVCLYALRHELLEMGFARFFQLFLQMRFPSSLQSVEEALLTRQGGLEIYLDLQQLACMMIEDEFKSNIAGEGFIEFLDNLAIADKEDPELQRQQDPDQESVQILTTHSSKGLEFDVVFALGLAARPRAPGYLLPLHSKMQAVSVESSSYQTFCEEADAEKMRQLYVALTRAKYRVYAPAIFLPALKAPAMGCASPMELFIAKLIQTPDLNHFCDFLQNAPISYDRLAEEALSVVFHSRKESPVLCPPRKVIVPRAFSMMQSFTGLAKKRHASIEEGVPQSNCLPLGVETGNMLHLIFERISPEIVRGVQSHEPLIEWIRPLIPMRFHEWEKEIAQIAFNVFTATLCTKEHQFRLCDVDFKNSFRETEFLYKAGEGSYLKGVIDLVCMHEGKYYLLDWKSNWLADYSSDKLSEAMEANDYYLQERIYRDAFQRYLRLVEPRPFEEVWGGSFYIFLRGVDPHQIPSPGILWIA